MLTVQSSKRSGLEKAIFQVEEAIKKRKSDAPEHKQTLEHLQKLLGEAQTDDGELATQTPGLGVGRRLFAPDERDVNLPDPFVPDERDMNPLDSFASDSRDMIPPDPFASDSRDINPPDPFASDSRNMKPPATLQHSERDHAGGSSDDQLAVEDVENPLQLLARASDLRIVSPDNHVQTPGGKFNGSEHSAYLDVHQFFLPMKAKLDQGAGYDPVNIGLVTKEEAKTLIT